MVDEFLKEGVVFGGPAVHGHCWLDVLADAVDYVNDGGLGLFLSRWEIGVLL